MADKDRTKDLEPSYGKPIPQPKLNKGEAQVFGELADSTDTAPSVDGERGMTFGDGVAANNKNIR